MRVSPTTPSAARMLELTRRMSTMLELTALAIHAALIAVMWPTGLAPWLIGFAIVIGPVNVAISTVGPERLGFDGTDWLRAAVNLVSHGALAAVCGWPLPAWLFVPLVTAIVGIPPASRGHLRATLVVVGFVGLALVTGGHPHDAAVFGGLAVFLHLMLSVQADVADGLRAERDQSAASLAAARERALAQDNLASIGQVAAGVAHEINNPMCFVTANVRDLLDELRRTPGLPPALCEFRDEVVPETLDGIARVNAITADLRRFARGEPVPRLRFDLASEVEVALRLCRPQIGDGQEVEAAVERGLWLDGTPPQLAQIVVNLVVNALQALGGPGRVRIAARAVGDRVELVVADTGCGMAPDVRARAFEPFFTTKPAGVGVGLGLAVVHGLVVAHDGRIAIDSAPGQGTTFRLDFPRAEPPPPAPPPPAPTRSQRLRAQPIAAALAT